MKNETRFGVMNEDLLLTVGVLAAALVYITKTALDYVTRRKNGKVTSEEDRIGKILKRVDLLWASSKIQAEQLKDLHDWHAPQVDVETGQPRFVWYVNVQDLKADIEAMNGRLTALIEAFSSDE